MAGQKMLLVKASEKFRIEEFEISYMRGCEELIKDSK